MKLSEIAKILNINFEGEDKEITGANTLDDANEHEITFISNKKYASKIPHTKAGAILIPQEALSLVPSHTTALVVDDPYWALAILSEKFAPPIEDEDGEAVIDTTAKVDAKATIAKNAKIGKNCIIMAGVYVGSGCEVGENTILYPNVVVYRDCKIGKNCIIHANSTIGGDGFGFATNKLGEHKKIYQNGNVIIEDDVEIGSSTTIDRAAFGSTIIKKGVHIDNLVQVAHNCEVGEFSVLVSQSGIAGSTKLGRNVVMGGQAASAGHLEIAPFNQFAARSGITKSIKESGKVWGGFPLYEQRVWLKLQGKIAKLLKS